MSGLTVRLTTQPDDEPEIQGKQRMLSELKGEIDSKLGGQIFRSKVEDSTTALASSDLSQSLDHILSGLSALSKAMGVASKVRNMLYTLTADSLLILPLGDSPLYKHYLECCYFTTHG